MSDPQPNGWSTYEKLVLQELKAHNAWLRDLSQGVQHCNIEIAKIKAMSAVLSAMGGIIGGGVVALAVRWLAP